MHFVHTCLSLAMLAIPMLCNGSVTDNLKLYASFDTSATPEIAKDGCSLNKAGKMLQTEGKWGKALHFPQNGTVGDLWYNITPATKNSQWTMTMWIRLDSPIGYGKGVKNRGLFRTDKKWNAGNVFARFDGWNRFSVTHLDADNKYCGPVISNKLFPVQEWVHLAFVYKQGKHQIFVNGIEVNYRSNKPVLKEKSKPGMLRIGSMDFNSRDQLGGAIDELMIFDCALAPADIKATMEKYNGK